MSAIEDTIAEIIEDFFGPHSKTTEVVDYLLREVSRVLQDPKVVYHNTKRGNFALLSEEDLADLYGEVRLRRALHIATRPTIADEPRSSDS